MSREQAMQMLQATIPTGGAAGALTAPVLSSVPPQTQVDTPAEASQPKPSELESTRFSQLAKKESELQRQRELLKKEQTQFMTESQKLAEMQKQFNTFTELKSKDPVAALKQLGFSETDLFNFIADQQDNSTPEEKAAKAAQAEIQKFTDAQAKKEADLLAKRNAEVLQEFRQKITTTIANDPDKYEYCNYHGPLAEELIYETVAAVLESDKVVISVEEAAQMVEQYYEDQDESMKTLKKRQPKAETAPAVAPEAPLKPQVSPKPMPSRTLSSKTGASVASTVAKPLNETPDQKKARLISKYLGPKQ